MSTSATNCHCPFCGFSDSAEYAILLHIEVHHAEGTSPFVVAGEVSRPAIPNEGGMSCCVDADEGGQWVECPVDGCGELLALSQLEDHVELHATEQSEDGLSVSPSSSSSVDDSDLDVKKPPKQQSSIRAYLSPYGHAQHRPAGGPSVHKVAAPTPASVPLPKPADMKEIKKLGESDLGRYHNEDQMPKKLVNLLKKHNYLSSQGVIPVLEQLLRQSHETQYAYICHPVAQHIWKLRGEGSFCGYRNIQMLISYLVGVSSSSAPPGAAAFAGNIPDIFRIQDLIEAAWDMGVNAKGRIETGGVKGTRKFIGTPEAGAIFVSLGIPCEIQGFRNSAKDEARAAETRLYDAVEQYFATAPNVNARDKVRSTTRAPLYFQHRGHSMTIVGIEKQRKGGVRNLLVFDPSYSDPSGVTRYIGRKFEHASPERVLKLYRRGPKYLGKYREFELLKYVHIHVHVTPYLMF
ncbi:DUF1671-domain-containing protein [Hypoxylon fuscum]|nr:DUF1671-domain-containing protein [Hypoxylon fuscum]